MLTQSYSCLRCGCEAEAADVALVEAMGWVIVGVTEDVRLVPSLCSICQRIAAGRRGVSLDEGAGTACVPRDADVRLIS